MILCRCLDSPFIFQRIQHSISTRYPYLKSILQLVSLMTQQRVGQQLDKLELDFKATETVREQTDNCKLETDICEIT